MTKDFKTSEELVQLLKSRGVAVDDGTKDAIERESYYAIVNGYKKPFLDYEAMEKANDDVYLPGTQFSWIYDLFLFDRELRFVTFRYLTKAEAIMRTAVAYAFSKAHQEKNAYLDRANFCDASNYLVPKKFKGNKTTLFNKNLNDLMKRINDKLVITHHTRDFIKHYITAHGNVPLWVLANDLTFGNIVHFYQLMQENDRRKTCTIIARVSKRDTKTDGALSERKLLRAANVLNHFRNICAHDERLYCARYNGEGYGMMIRHLTNLLPKNETNLFANEIVSLYFDYKDRLHNMNFLDLLAEMGFPTDTMME